MVLLSKCYEMALITFQLQALPLSPQPTDSSLKWLHWLFCGMYMSLCIVCVSVCLCACLCVCMYVVCVCVYVHGVCMCVCLWMSVCVWTSTLSQGWMRASANVILFLGSTVISFLIRSITVKHNG